MWLSTVAPPIRETVAEVAGLEGTTTEGAALSGDASGMGDCSGTTGVSEGRMAPPVPDVAGASEGTPDGETADEGPTEVEDTFGETESMTDDAMADEGEAALLADEGLAEGALGVVVGTGVAGVVALPVVVIGLPVVVFTVVVGLAVVFFVVVVFFFSWPGALSRPCSLFFPLPAGSRGYSRYGMSLRRWYARCPQAPALAHASVTERTERRTPRAMVARIVALLENGEDDTPSPPIYRAERLALVYWFLELVCPRVSRTARNRVKLNRRCRDTAALPAGCSSQSPKVQGHPSGIRTASA